MTRPDGSRLFPHSSRRGRSLQILATSPRSLRSPDCASWWLPSLSFNEDWDQLLALSHMRVKQVARRMWSCVTFYRSCPQILGRRRQPADRARPDLGDTWIVNKPGDPGDPELAYTVVEGIPLRFDACMVSSLQTIHH